MIWDHLYDEYDENTSNVVDVYIRYLRNKIDKGFDPPLILTRWGEGYMLRGEDDPPAAREGKADGTHRPCRPPGRRSSTTYLLLPVVLLARPRRRRPPRRPVRREAIQAREAAETSG